MQETPIGGYAKELPTDNEVEDVVQQSEKEHHQEAGTGIINIHLHADGGGGVSNDGLRNPVNADGQMSQRVLD